MLKAIQMLGSSSSSSGGIGITSTIVSQSRHKLKPKLIETQKIIISTKPNFQSFWPKTHRFILSSHMSSSSSSATAGYVVKIKFCQWCGGPAKHEIPDGEERMRAICTHCGKIAYQNPKMVVGCLIEHQGKVLLCKRNIEPSYGLWTLPAGYMEIGESGVEGAIRETWEEARAEVEVLSPFAQLDIPLIGQTYVIFLAKLKKPQFAPGPESLECQLFMLDEIPFDSLAFSSIYVTLSLYKEDVKNGRLKYHYGTINKRPGSGPSDARAYTLDYHMES